MEKSKLSLLLQYSSFIECTAWRYVALAAVSASLASDRFGSREFCEEDERAFTRLELSSSLDLADLVSILCFGLILTAAPSCIVLLLAEAAADKTELVDWSRMEMEEGESAFDQVSLILWRLSAKRVL